jgi:hypothetical protein
MKNIAYVVLFLLLLLVSIILPYNIIVGQAALGDNEYVIKSSVRFTTYGQTWNFAEEEKAISLYMNNSWQTVNLINSSIPLESVKTDEDGNSIALLNLSPIQYGRSIEYTVYYQVVSSMRNLPGIDESTAQSLSAIPSNLTDLYLGNSGTWMTNNTELRNQANHLAGNETKVLVIVENFVRWMWDTIEYKTHDVPLYPTDTLSLKEGDCDDQAILLVSLCRIVGIPAYLQLGCIYMPLTSNESSTGWNGHITSIQNHIGWHGWAMVYVPPWGWLPVDLTYIYALSKDDPLNAIKTAAVTSQDVIQYMNVIQTDYVSNSEEYRSFLQNKNFYITTYDEVIPGSGTGPFDFISESITRSVIAVLDFLSRYALVLFLCAGIIACSLIGMFHVMRTKKKSIENL